MKGSVQVKFRLPAVVSKKNGWFISSCPLLDVFSQGKTKKQALDNLQDALKLFIESCFERGTLGKILKQSGFETSDARRPALPDGHQDYVNVPLSLIAKRHAEARTH
jgi:predicted RNase H-like HicB family nuclease